MARCCVPVPTVTVANAASAPTAAPAIATSVTPPPASASTPPTTASSSATSAYTLSDTDSGHHLPLALSLAPANRHDGVSLLGLLTSARRLLPEIGAAITTVSADSAHDHDAVYNFCVALGASCS